MTATVTLDKNRRIVGRERENLAKSLVKRYTTGESIRAPGGGHRSFVRLHPSCAVRERRAAPQAWRCPHP